MAVHTSIKGKKWPNPPEYGESMRGGMLEERVYGAMTSGLQAYEAGKWKAATAM
jgi:hypothetical protein